MKKKNIINLIRYHSEGNEAGFRSEAYEVAKEFDQLADTIGGVYYGTPLERQYLCPPSQVTYHLAFLKR